MRLSPRNLAAAGLVSLLPSLALGGGIPTSTQWLEEVVVTGKLERLGGEPTSATVGIVTSEQLDLRPVLRTGELLEVVPGLIVTQHSGERQSEPVFPARLQSRSRHRPRDQRRRRAGEHADACARPGLHRHQLRDSRADRVDRVSQGHVLRGHRQFLGGRRGEPALSLGARRAVRRRSRAARTTIVRGLFAASPEIGGGTLLFGARALDDDGPWLLEERFHKTNALLRYSHETAGGRFASPRRATTASGARPTRFRCAPCNPARSIASASSIRPTAASRIATASAADWYERARRGPSARAGLRDRLSARPVLELHVRTRYRERRPVRAVRRSPRLRRRADLGAAVRLTGPLARAGRRRAKCATTISTPSAVSHRRARAHRHDARG